MKIALHWQIAIAIVAAVLTGFAVSAETAIFGVMLVSIFDFLGTLFLNALKMVVVPLVLSSIICAVAGLNEGGDLGRLGAKTLGFYLVSSLLAIVVGLVFVNVLTPGYIDGEPAGAQLNLGSGEALQAQLDKVEGKGSGDIAKVFLRMLPPNIVEAAANTQMLGLITFGLLFGFFMMKTPAKQRETQLTFWQGAFNAMMGITLFVMKFTPIGVFGLIAKTVVMTGFGALGSMVLFLLTVILALATHMFLTMPIILSAVARVSPLAHFKAMMPALLTAFSTASSSGTLPLTMKCVEQNSGVSRKTTGFVLPLGATINMDGTALYECVAAMFIAQAYGLDLTLGVQFLIVVTALLTSIGVAGIPSASLVAITVILAAIGLPAEGIGLLMLTDRILDMLRTSVNVFSDSCCAVFVARMEGETTHISKS